MKKPPESFGGFFNCGEDGIRTPVTLAGKHIFETCAIIHSATSPNENIISVF